VIPLSPRSQSPSHTTCSHMTWSAPSPLLHPNFCSTHSGQSTGATCSHTRLQRLHLLTTRVLQNHRFCVPSSAPPTQVKAQVPRAVTHVYMTASPSHIPRALCIATISASCRHLHFSHLDGHERSHIHNTHTPTDITQTPGSSTAYRDAADRHFQAKRTKPLTSPSSSSSPTPAPPSSSSSSSPSAPSNCCCCCCCTAASSPGCAQATPVLFRYVS